MGAIVPTTDFCHIGLRESFRQQSRVSTALLFRDSTRFIPVVGRYSVSYDVLGVAIERVMGAPLDQVLKTWVLDPLKMTDTGEDMYMTL
jgi:hypothetical protein